MRFIDRKRRIEYLLEMIKRGRCLSLSQIADSFDCSERTVKRLISEIREEGNDIRYCRKQKKFIEEPERI